jgi:hypothetical protein
MVQLNDTRDEEQIVEVQRWSRIPGLFSQMESLIWLALGLLEALIGLRVFLELIAANPQSPFAYVVYVVSAIFVWPFFGLTATPAIGNFVLDIPSIIAMIVYLLLTWAAVSLLGILFPRTSGQRIIRRHWEEE